MSTNMTPFQAKAAFAFHRSGLLVKKYSPEILLGAGVIGFVAAAVMAAKATLQAPAILEEMNANLDKVHEAREKLTDEQFSEDAHTKALGATYVKSGLQFATLYGPSVGIGVLSLAAILGSHGIMSRRSASMAAAYGLLAEGFSAYRKRVVEELGADKDREFRHGEREEVVEVVEIKDGKEVASKKKVRTYEDQLHSEYARFFDESSHMWKQNAQLNLFFLKTQEAYANDKLRIQGHLFLNEVYDMLGLPRTKAGAVVGWIYNKHAGENIGGGDNYVDFDIYNPDNPASHDFVNGYNRSILLDFNVDGMIYDLL